MKNRLRDHLLGILSPKELTHVYNSYDVIGDIAIIRAPEKCRKYRRIIAEAIMNVHKNTKTVLAQTSPVHGDFRVRKIEFVAGENKTNTVHKEFGCLFSVDVEKCYFSPRLLYERMRIAKQVRNGEVVVNMFAGVGCFSIVIAKHSKAEKVYSVDANPTAIRFMRESIKLNRVYGKVVPLQGDAKEIIEKRLNYVADRVLMPLPRKALEYLPYALLCLKKTGGRIHCYDFEHAKKKENPIQKAELKVKEKLEGLSAAFEVALGRVVRTTGPNWYQIVLDIVIKQ